MRNITPLAIIAVLMLAVACGGGGAFVPDNGPFNGQFLVDTTSNGTFTFTVNNAALGGTGSLIHNNQAVVVTISANVFGKTIDGVIQNANLGYGTFTGQFHDENQAAGSYSYTDAGGLTTQSGTWYATFE